MREWSEADQPREKLMRSGASTLSDAELLAILLRSGTASESALDVAKHIMAEVGNNLAVLNKMSAHDMMRRFKGIGLAKSASVLAALELGKRRQLSEMPARPHLNDSRKIYDWMFPRLAEKKTEECWALFLNAKNRLIGESCISRGGVNSTAADPRVVMREAVQQLASAVIICHNHPSGIVDPSPEDNRMTSAMSVAARSLGLVLVDHLIVCDGSYYSYADNGRL